MKEAFGKYLQDDLEYFHGISYDDENLQLLFSSLNDYRFLIIRNFFLVKSDLLNFQAGLLD
ncbi:MAG: hypothetical protein LBV74_18750 [Tannerella sp.]|jgi:hypothetical protein|nr:hypothetical protein [Tannerella sp.]